MNGTKIKICGLSRPEDIEAANRIRPEFIGFVFWEKSKRYVDPDTAAALRMILDPHIKSVGVFVDEPAEEVSYLLNRGIIDIAQLHGHEDEDYIDSLREMTDKPVMKAFQLKGESEEETRLTLLQAKYSSADYVLIDSGMGSGKTFDWDLLKNFDREYFLAGGLDEGNVAEAIRKTHCFAVDVSSNVETDGRKDEKKMAGFVDAVRSTRD